MPRGLSGSGTPATTHAGWCFTAWDLSAPEGGAAVPLAEQFVRPTWSTSPEPVKAFHYQLERCEKTSRLHLQGVLMYHRRVSFTTAKAALAHFFTSTVHVSHIQTSYSACQNYASKDKTKVAGPWSSDDDPVRLPLPPIVHLDRKVEFWFGQPGCGKTREARILLREKFGEEPLMLAKSDASSGTWLSGYTGQKGIIIAEFQLDMFSIANWKLLLDSEMARLPVKSGGESVDWVALHIIIIANGPPPAIFLEPAFMRRFTNFRYIDRPVHPDVRQATFNYDPAHPPTFVGIESTELKKGRKRRPPSPAAPPRSGPPLP